MNRNFQFMAIFFSIALLRDWSGQPQILYNLFVVACTISFLVGVFGREDT